MHPELLQHTSAEPRWSFSSSLVLHLLIVLVVCGVSYLVIEAVQDPRIPIGFSDFAAPPPAPPPPPPPAGSASSAALIEQPVERPLEKIVQPDMLPEELLVPPERSSGSGVEDGVPGGLQGGLPGGVPGGDPNGTPGGVPGSIGGVPDGGGLVAPIVPTPDMTLPVLISKVEPEYPEVARAARLQGRVFLQAVIEEDGSVGEVTVLSSPNHWFGAAATDAVRQWKYKPALQNGQPVPVYFTVVVEFTLH